MKLVCKEAESAYLLYVHNLVFSCTSPWLGKLTIDLVANTIVRPYGICSAKYEGFWIFDGSL
jgi:hypothetical protein